MAKKSITAENNTNDYASYLRFYPNKIEAIQALRVDTGLNAMEAKKIIDRLFGADVMPTTPTFKRSSQLKAASSSGCDWHAETIEVDVGYYAQKYYPNKSEAIHALRQLGVGDADARNAIENAFLEIQKKKHQKDIQRKKKDQKAVKTVGKTAGLTALFGGYGVFWIVSRLVKPYMGKRR